MTRLTPHFQRKEFQCPCCDGDTVDVELMRVMNQIRQKFGRPVHIHSGFRCPSYNKEVGSPNSLHMQGKAADFHVSDVDLGKVFSWLTFTYPDKYGIGLYPAHIHIDVRPTKARWNG